VKAKALASQFYPELARVKAIFPSASRQHFTGDELLPVYPQQNSAFGADVYGRFGVEGTGDYSR